MRGTIYNIIKTTLRGPEKLAALFGPNFCLGCGQTGDCLCLNCRNLAINPPPPRCFGCQKKSPNHQTCSACRKKLLFHSLIYADNYQGLHKLLVKTMKYQANRQAARDIGLTLAKLASEQFDLNKIDLIIPTPTAPRHIRQRGYDHTKLIAEQCAQQLHLPLILALKRITNTRQVGQSKTVRQHQMISAMQLKNQINLHNSRILLIDDIITTGATLTAATKLLKQAGAKRIDVLVFASSK